MSVIWSFVCKIINLHCFTLNIHSAKNPDTLNRRKANYLVIFKIIF